MKKIIGIFVLTLLITSIVLPVYGIKNEIQENKISLGISSNAEWIMTYGDDKFEMLHCVQQTNDDGFIACGIKTSYDLSEGHFRPWVIKTNVNGELEWEWALDALQPEGRFFSVYPAAYCMLIHQTKDNGYITAFRIHGQADNEYWVSAILKLNENGEEEWREFCMDALEWNFGPHSIIELDDGSFLLAGFSGTTEIGDEEDFACLYKIDSNGKEQWRQEYNYGALDSAWALCKTSDNGYLLTGWADYNDYLMIKTDSNGNKEWDKTFGGENQDFSHARNCYQTADGGYIMSGYTYSFGNGQADVWIVKTDSMGNMDWNRTYGDNSRDLCWSFESTNDDTYVFCITYNYGLNFFDKEDIHLVKMDSDGHIVWTQVYGGSDRHFGQHICRTSDGGFIVSGRTGPYGDYSSDGLLIKFAKFDNERPNKPEKPTGPRRGEPNTEYTFTTGSTDPDGDSLKFMWDWGDGNFSDILDTNEATYSWSYEANFEVRVMAIDEKGGESDWSDPLVFSTPKYRAINTIILERIFNQFPILKKLF